MTTNIRLPGSMREVSALARALKARLGALKHTQILDAIAEAHGYRNRQALASAIDAETAQRAGPAGRLLATHEMIDYRERDDEAPPGTFRSWTAEIRGGEGLVIDLRPTTPYPSEERVLSLFIEMKGDALMVMPSADLGDNDLVLGVTSAGSIVEPNYGNALSRLYQGPNVQGRAIGEVFGPDYAKHLGTTPVGRSEPNEGGAETDPIDYRAIAQAFGYAYEAYVPSASSDGIVHRPTILGEELIDDTVYTDWKVVIDDNNLLSRPVPVDHSTVPESVTRALLRPLPKHLIGFQVAGTLPDGSVVSIQGETEACEQFGLSSYSVLAPAAASALLGAEPHTRLLGISAGDVEHPEMIANLAPRRASSSNTFR